MGGKKGKKESKKKKKGASEDDAGEDESTQKLYSLYGRKCVELGTKIPLKLREKFDEALDEAVFLTEINIWDPVGWQGAKALGDALLDTKYDKLKSLRFWKCNIEDNGLRYICNYLMTNKTVETLELMDNNISPLGCEFLGRVLKQEVGSPISTLKLDHNPIGAAGVAKLAEGLCMNPTLKILSMNYCEIDKTAAKAMAQIFVYVKSELKEVMLRGNNLESEGVKEVLSAIKISKNLLKIDLADNKVKELSAEGELVKQLGETVTFEKCPVRGYDMSYNHFDETALEKIASDIETGGMVYDFKLTTKMEDDFRSSFKKILDLNKKKAKKKKGKKKGKKKKKA